jgi:DNA-3-methyladenine glycosylase
MNTNTAFKTSTPSLSPLPIKFYERRTDDVAKDLLGKLLVRKISNENLRDRAPGHTHDIYITGRIVEVEAYFGPGDPASHACKGPTPRSSIMFGRAGVAYVYLNYGVHSLLNIVTDLDGTAGAVLLRALEPVAGVDFMLANRPVKRKVDITNGPGKLTKAIGITIEHNGLDITKMQSGLYIADDPDRAISPSITVSERIGITDGKDMLLRFSIEGNPYVSR